MQISKTLLTLLAVALCAGTVSQAAPDSAAQAKAREALRRKLAELEAQPVSEAPSTPDSDAQAKAREALRKKIAEPEAQAGWGAADTSPPDAPDSEAQAKARQALLKRFAELDAQPVMETPKGRGTPTPTVFDPIPAPPSPLSASKEARLAELLKQYRADTLTPEQYHKERAKILAEP